MWRTVGVREVSQGLATPVHEPDTFSQCGPRFHPLDEGLRIALDRLGWRSFRRAFASI